jgi:hypothetical protein
VVREAAREAEAAAAIGVDRDAPGQMRPGAVIPGAQGRALAGFAGAFAGRALRMLR